MTQFTLMKKVFTFLVIFLSLVSMSLISANTYAEVITDSTNSPAESRLMLTYLCSTDSVTLTANLGIKKGETIFALENALVEFTASNSTTSHLLIKSKTDQEGNAVCKVASSGLPADKDGLVVYSVKFIGNNKYPGAESSFNAKPAKIRLFFSIEDSLRMLKVTATQKNEKGEEVAIPKETVLIYIPRLFSLLKIGEIALDENGTGTMEFPKEIVGDTLGNLEVMAKIEENDKFGFVLGKNIINWGVHKQYYKAEVPSRELWTPIAPLWMIITLLVMLAGVWAHYMYAVYELIMIKRLSKKDKPLF